LSFSANTRYWFSVANHASNWNWALGDIAGPTIGSGMHDAARSTGSCVATVVRTVRLWDVLAGTDFTFRIHVPEPATFEGYRKMPSMAFFSSQRENAISFCSHFPSFIVIEKGGTSLSHAGISIFRDALGLGLAGMERQRLHAPHGSRSLS